MKVEGKVEKKKKENTFCLKETAIWRGSVTTAF